MEKEEAEKMTLQEFIDYLCKKIVEQGCQCLGIVDGLNCAYSDKKGNNCIVGHGLSNNLLKKVDDSDNAGRVADKFKDEVPCHIVKNKLLFNDLQDFHDYRSKHLRKSKLSRMKKAYCEIVDFSGDHWQQWVEMGAE